MERVDDYRALHDRLSLLRHPAIVGVEGFTGSGKSKLSNDLGRDLKADVFHTDAYVVPGDESLPYLDRLDCGRFTTEINLAKSRRSLIFVEGICLRDVLERLTLSADIFIYVKRVAGNRLWHDGLDLEYFEARSGIEEFHHEPCRSDYSYHVAARPHEHADLVYERIEADNC